MPKNIYSQAARGLVSACLLLTLGSGVARAQEDYVVDTFDSSDEASSWARWWGSAEQTYEFDGTMDAAGSSSSGSLKATIGFNLASYAGDNQFCLLRSFADSTVLDGTKYTNLVFDVRVDPSSPQNTSGNYGNLEFGFRDSSWGSADLSTLTLTTSHTTGWTHVVAAIDPTAKNIDVSAGVFFKLWSGGDGGLTGNTVLWIDNVKLIAITNTTVIKPTLAMKTKLNTGLEIAASASGQQYQRQCIATRTTDTNETENAYSWYGKTAPVTYSMTLKSFPGTNYGGFQAHMFIAPTSGMPYGSGDTSIDWNASHLVFFQIAYNDNQEIVGRFMYKTNQPSGNSMIWNTDETKGAVGSLAFLTNSTAIGTWSITFNNNNQITMTAPGGVSTNFTMPADAAALFADPAVVYFGVQPNQIANIGQSAVFSRLQITGTTTALDDSFTGDTLDTAIWQTVAADAGGISVVPPTAAFQLSWGAPATGFVVQASPTLAADSWYDPGLSNVVQVGSSKKVLVPQSTLTNANTFYRLIKQAASQ